MDDHRVGVLDIECEGVIAYEADADFGAAARFEAEVEPSVACGDGIGRCAYLLDYDGGHGATLLVVDFAHDERQFLACQQQGGGEEHKERYEELYPHRPFFCCRL